MKRMPATCGDVLEKIHTIRSKHGERERQEKGKTFSLPSIKKVLVFLFVL